MPRATRRRVEIYFILYLLALVLLLPDKPMPAGGGMVLPGDLRLDLQPERVRMECNLVRDSSGGLRIRSLDSENVIRYNTGLTDVDVRARIEDAATGQVLMVDAGRNPAALFELQLLPERQTVLFRWHPNYADATPRTLRVTLQASAVPADAGGPNAGAGRHFPTGLRLNGTAQFVLVTNVTRHSENGQTELMPRVDTIRIIDSSARRSMGTFWIEPARDLISGISQQPWAMRLSMGGADPMRDLAALPLVQASNGATVERYLDTAARMLMVRGTIPRSGKYTVNVVAHRADGQVAQTSFDVQCLSMPAAMVASVMYPGVEYTIETNLPDLEGAKAVVLDGGREVAATSASVLSFTPRLSDTGKTLQFVRLIAGDRVETPVAIHVRGFPPPEIRDVKDYGSGDKKKVIVKFYGDKNRDRPSLEVVDGNVRSVRKLFGNIHAANDADDAGVAWIDEFEVTRKDNGQPFTFTIQARDQRGRTSALWREPAR
ncbi:MAG: hypothetical protein D8M52_09700 [Chlorobi bacterium]|nr:MAG: hypothetical protein F9K28_08390 [Bacteroidota bacterium]KXK34985.1 MAG: hypothetical protein UZ06_CHB003000808 [Chlorobi bacterium OLB6]MBE2265162.1 hypothetical protein [Flavobacteriales bacterium]MBL1161975.1 hypothetical protein [Chlorobiota bacterium]MBW7854490.1 hypothetical protein [Candidatus Kapabacteria bacterium]MCC6331767.1 hypothetical protein [Ignavibacteria bacterium]